jgi:oligogalacturonide lyase
VDTGNGRRTGTGGAGRASCPPRVCSRRRFVAALSAPVLAGAAIGGEPEGRGRVFPPVAMRYPDPATEAPVLRLTDPQFRSILPPSSNRIVAARAILFASDMAGSWQAFLMDLKTREARQLTEAEALDPESLALARGDKVMWHFDGRRLVETDLGRLRTRDLYEVPEGFEKLPGASFGEVRPQPAGEASQNRRREGGARRRDPRREVCAFVEKSAAGYRLRILQVDKGTALTLLESPDEIRGPVLRPRYGSVLFRKNGELWSMNLDGRGSRKVALAGGETLDARWSEDGRALEYLNRPPGGGQVTLREWIPETGEDRAIAPTSQFVRFEPNANASVYVGASGSKASPYVLLLIRAVKREITLAEHHASDAAMVRPAFSPDSQFVVFVSDRHGKPAIYWIGVDKFVAETDGS